MEYVRFAEECRKKGTTPTALTLKLGLSKGNASTWKKGGNPSADILIKISAELGVSIDYLLGISNNPEISKGGATTDYLLTGKATNLKLIANEKENEKMNGQMHREVQFFRMLPTCQKLKALRLEMGLTVQEVGELLKFGNSNEYKYDDGYEDETISKAHIRRLYEEDKAKFIKFFDYPYLFIEDLPEPSDIKKTDLSHRIFGQREEKRAGKGISQQELADTIGVELISVISWESGERIPCQACLRNLNGYLHLGDDIMKKYDTELTAEKTALSKTGGEMAV